MSFYLKLLGTACSVTGGFHTIPLSYSQSCCASVLEKHSLKRQCMVWQKLSMRDFGEAYRHLDSGTLSGCSVKWSQVSWIVSGSSCWNTWTTQTETARQAECKMWMYPRGALHLKCQYIIRNRKVSVSMCDICGGYARSICTKSSGWDGWKSRKTCLVRGKRKIDHQSVFLPSSFNHLHLEKANRWFSSVRFQSALADSFSLWGFTPNSQLAKYFLKES